jgi:hypothetical protein
MLVALAASLELIRVLQRNLALGGTEPGGIWSMIVGLALVIDDISKGQRLVFRYPASDQKTAPAAGKHVSRCGASCRKQLVFVHAAAIDLLFPCILEGTTCYT